MAISERMTRVPSVYRLKAELQKTMVLRANCQRRITAQERGWFRNKRVRGIKLKVHPERLELPTFCSEDRRSVQLSYGCNFS
jgi:hypothetical protein